MADSQLPTSNVYQGGDPDPLARIGEIVGGRYRLLEFIGQGGMGNVYRGEHTTIRKPIALKLLHPSLANIPELRSRFEREAFAIGRINHPNCVEVFDFGELGDGSLFLAMEYLDGESAADLLDRDRPLEPGRALLIIRHVLAGLGHAHMVGIVHRDIKPENIFVLGDAGSGDATFSKVLDFGIAKLLDEADDASGREKLTQAGITFGTPAYLSPEQALGDPADTRSDLYSVAVVLYELLAGVPPFRSPDKMELLAMHASRPAPPLSEALQRTFSPALEAVLAKGLAKRRKARFQSAEEFIEALDSLGMFPRPPSATDTTTGTIRPLTPIPHALPHPATPYSKTSGKRKSLPWALIAFAIGVVAVATTTVVILSQRTLILADVKQTAMSDVTKKASAIHKEGAPEEAIEYIRKADSSDTDASAQLLLGHAHASQAEYDEATLAYSRALILDENSVRDVEMVTNLRLMIDDNGPIYFEALRLLAEYGTDEAAITRLTELASHKKAKLRKEAFELAETLGHTEKIDRVQSFLYDLDQGATCAERKTAVPKLRALGDKRAIKGLEAARYRRGKKIRRKKYKNANACLSAEARDAARFLKSK